jgi:hypothetical protein
MWHHQEEFPDTPVFVNGKWAIWVCRIDPDCIRFDLDGDGDVDMRDFSLAKDSL